jgi:hypothetical protein
MATATTATTGLSDLGQMPITPDFQLQALRTIIGQGGAIAASPYVGYSGPRLANLTPDQLNAQQMTRSMASGMVIDPSQMQNAISYGLSGFDPAQVTKYMSPYTTGVVDEIARQGNKNLMQNVLPQVNTTFAGAGQFGSTRNADFTNQAMASNQAEILGKQSDALQGAYDSALGAYRNWHQDALGNTVTAGNLGATAAGNLNTAGQQNQAETQKSYDLAYSDFQNQLNYPKQQLGWLASLNSGQNMPSATATPTYDYTTAPSPLSQGLGTAAQIYGMFTKG